MLRALYRCVSTISQQVQQCSRDAFVSACLYHSINEGFSQKAIAKAHKEFGECASSIVVNEYDIVNHCRNICVGNIKQSYKDAKITEKKIDIGMTALLESIYPYKKHWSGVYQLCFASNERILESSSYFNRCVNEMLANDKSSGLEYISKKSTIATLIILMELQMCWGHGDKVNLINYIKQTTQLYDMMDMHGGRCLNVMKFYTNGIISALAHSTRNPSFLLPCQDILSKLLKVIECKK